MSASEARSDTLLSQLSAVADPADLLELQLTNMTTMQQRLVKIVVEELRGRRAQAHASECLRCAEVSKLYGKDEPESSVAMIDALRKTQEALTTSAQEVGALVDQMGRARRS